MTVQTTSKTVTFVHPFNLSGMDETQPAGTYTVETDEELLEDFNADTATGATQEYGDDPDR